MEAFAAGLLTVGLAELGDKTQLLVFVLVRQFRRPLVVMLAMVIAFLVSFAVAGAFGAWLQQSILMDWIRGISALMFIAIGCWMLFAGDEPAPALQSKPTSGASAFALALVTVLIAELGDKSQLTVVALAITLEPVGWIVLGALMGTLLVNLPVIWIGQRSQTNAWINDRLHRWIRYSAASVFVLLGLLMLWTQFVSGTSNA